MPSMVTVNEIVSRRRTSVWEAQIARELRRLPEAQAFHILVEAIPQRPLLSLLLANKVLRSKKYYLELLSQGMALGNASTIEWWLKCCAPRLGCRLMLRELKKSVGKKPDAVRRAIYWLPSIINKKDSVQRSLLEGLINDVGHPTPIRVNGLYHPQPD